ncbi:hypothetical protein EYF80_056607 [Liparis tanakae]|uniref:Uncharacterized protein n=1 Tax=Liparis tanakae TaxID=230148 RepID=A0A4Z2EWE5_9TELE|nr:hypothetical protein EYF80_056607 [Liparis tanakae]
MKSKGKRAMFSSASTSNTARASERSQRRVYTELLQNVALSKDKRQTFDMATSATEIAISQAGTSHARTRMSLTVPLLMMAGYRRGRHIATYRS